MNLDPRSLAEGFILWWSDPGANEDFESMFDADLSYSQRPGFSDHEALWHIRQRPPWTDLERDLTVVGDDRVQIDAIGIDPVTGLRHSMRWQLTLRRGKVATVVESMGSGEVPSS